jgi:hypothetical protein
LRPDQAGFFKELNSGREIVRGFEVGDGSIMVGDENAFAGPHVGQVGGWRFFQFRRGNDSHVYGIVPCGQENDKEPADHT